MWERSVPPITLLNTLRAFRSSHHPPKKIASVPFLPSPFYKTCERSVPPITLRSPSYKFCERSVPPINLLQNLRAFRSSHHPSKKFASAPFLPSPSYKICERSVPPITLLKNASVPFLPCFSLRSCLFSLRGRTFSLPSRQGPREVQVNRMGGTLSVQFSSVQLFNSTRFPTKNMGQASDIVFLPLCSRAPKDAPTR